MNEKRLSIVISTLMERLGVEELSIPGEEFERVADSDEFIGISLERRDGGNVELKRVRAEDKEKAEQKQMSNILRKLKEALEDYDK